MDPSNLSDIRALSSGVGIHQELVGPQVGGGRSQCTPGSHVTSAKRWGRTEHRRELGQQDRPDDHHAFCEDV